MRKRLKDLFKLNKEQKENNKNILKVLALIVGSVFVAEGILSLFPESLKKYMLIGIGVILVIISVLD